MSALLIVVFALGLPVLVCATYLLFLALAAKEPPARDEKSRREAAPRLRFALVVPAHDEAAGIKATIESLAAVDYPPELRRIFVVADNCADATASIAEEAGAVVFTRDDPSRKGKGYALAFALDRIEKEGLADAVVVIDADSVVTPNLLRAFAERFEAGAAALQADYTVRNPEASWRTRLMYIAFTLFHVLRSLARERLGLSVGLRGNGMGFSVDLIRRVPYRAYSLVEDVEHGITLGEAGYRVHYVPEAKVLGEMVTGERASGSQRARWEGGRAAIARSHAPRLLAAGFSRRDPVLLDLAMDVLLPPLSTILLAASAGSAAAVLACWALGGSALFASPWLLSIVFLAIYVLRGWVLSGAGLRGLADLCWAPVYIVWKIGLAMRRPRARRGEWVRTARMRGDGER